MIDGQSWFFITGPKVTKVVTGEDVTLDQLGGPALHAKRTGFYSAIYFQDTWNATRKLTLNYGWRGDWFKQKQNLGQKGVDRKVGSPRVKLLFDVYHVQIMNGDLIRRIEQTKDIIGHVHTAGVPGRGELDESQEIHYPAVMRKLVEVGYAGYVGQEFIPTRNPLDGLRQAVALCRAARLRAAAPYRH